MREPASRGANRAGQRPSIIPSRQIGLPRRAGRVRLVAAGVPVAGAEAEAVVAGSTTGSAAIATESELTDDDGAAEAERDPDGGAA